MLTIVLCLLTLGAAPLLENVPGVKQIQNFVRYAREYVKVFVKGE